MKFYLLLSIFICLEAVQIKAQSDSVFSVRPFGYGVIKKYYSGHDAVLVNKKKQKKWISESIRMMKQLPSVENIQISEPQILNIPDLQKITYRIQDCRTIVFKNGEKVLICIHSAHEDPEIGDVSIGIDHKNKVYVNYGHICGSIINFENFSLDIPKNVCYFIKNFVSDTDDLKWQKW